MLPMFNTNTKDYLSISLPHTVPPDSSLKLFILKLKRKWRQTPHLLRILFSLIILSFIVFIVRFFTASNFTTNVTESDIEGTQSKETIEEVIQVTNPKIERLKPEESLERTIDKSSSREHGGFRKFTPKQEAVIKAMKHAWNGYKKCSWGLDHLNPLSCTGENWFGLGLTIVDALDTLWLMDLKQEFEEAKDWVSTRLDFNKNKLVNLFETTIRVLGGLISAYHLSKDQIFLTKSVELGNKLMGAFETKSGIPYSDVNLYTGLGTKPGWGPDSSTSEVTTIQLEFRELSRLTGDSKYADKVNHIMRHIHSIPGKLDGLVPIFINAQTGKFQKHSTITLGARGDSYYEYLLKQWLQFGRTEDVLKQDYEEAIQGMETHLAKRTQPNKYLFFGEISGLSRSMVYKMDELTCYLPGTLALGVRAGLNQHHLEIAKDLMRTCVQTWLRHPTKLAPEITFFNVGETSTDDFFVKKNDAHYLLRPETIESLWYMYVITGDPQYQEWGWEIFQGVEKHCRVDNGYSTIQNVKDPEYTRPKNKMESFFLAETLKYFFFLFADQDRSLDLDKFVLNTEGHLMPIHPN